jgi:hypothetical protein
MDDDILAGKSIAAADSPLIEARLRELESRSEVFVSMSVKVFALEFMVPCAFHSPLFLLS